MIPFKRKCIIFIGGIIIMAGCVSIMSWMLVEYWYKAELKLDEDYAQSLVDNPIITSTCVIINCTRYNETCTRTEFTQDEEGYSHQTGSYAYPCGKVKKIYNETTYGCQISETYEVSINTTFLQNCGNAKNRTCQYCIKTPTVSYFSISSCEPSYESVASKVYGIIIALIVGVCLFCSVICLVVFICLFR